MKKVILTALTVVALLSSCKKKEETVTNQAPAVTISSNDQYLRTAANVGDSYSYYATATDADGSISKVVFYANNTPYDTVTVSAGSNKYYDDFYTATAEGDVKFSAVAYDNAGASTKSNEITVNFSSGKQEVQVQEVKVK